MSRPLVAWAALAFLVASLLPILAMLGRLVPADLALMLDARALGLLQRTVVLGLSAAALSLVLGLPFGFLVARTDLPAAALLRQLGIVPFLLPPLILAMATTGMLPEMRGAWAAALVLGVNTFPLVALFSARAFERVDAPREEAALLAGGLRAALRMELPLVLPSALCGAALGFAFAVNDFAVPDYVSSVGPRFPVWADEVFASWQVDRRAGRAVAAALPLVLLALAALLPALVLRRTGALTTLGPGWRRPAPLALGRGRLPAFVFAAGLVAATAILPLLRLVFEAGGGPSGWSAARLSSAFGRAIELGGANLRASLSCSLAAAALCLPLGLVLGHALGRARRGRLLETVVLLPVAAPAILFGIGEIVLWNRAATAGLYDSHAMVVLLMAGRFAPFAVLIAAGAVASLDVRVEEAARLAGAGPARRLVRIVAPLARPALLGGAALVFVLSMREIDAAILVPAANETVLFRVYNAVHFARDDFVAALSLLSVFFVLLPGILWALFGRERLEVLP